MLGPDEVRAAAELVKSGAEILTGAKLLQPTMEKVGSTLAEVVDAKVLSRVRRRFLTPGAAAEVAAADVQARLAGVPAELVIEPAPIVVAGVIEALQTRADEPTLRAMFAELLASTCRRDRADGVHLAFVEVLRQLEPDEARLLDVIRTARTVRAWSEHVDLAGMQPTRADFTMRIIGPRELAESPRLGTFQGNLLRLGLLAMHTRVAPRTLYYGAGADMVTTATFGLTDFGRDFLAVCAPDGIPSASPDELPRA